MYKIDNSTATTTRPPSTPPGTPGWYTDGNPGAGNPATILPAEWLNAVQDELINILVAANVAPDKSKFNQLSQALIQLSQIYGTSSRKTTGLLGAVDATTALTAYDLSADAVTAVDAGGRTYTRYGIANSAVNLATAGPVAGGRDQAAVFPPSSWVHIFYIFNPTSNSGAWIASLAAPTTGPALPPGYAAWAYATTLNWNASSNIIPGFMQGDTFVYDLPDNSVNRILSGGHAIVMTTVSAAPFVPPNAIRTNFIANLTVTGGIAVVNGFVRRTGSTQIGQNLVTSSVQATGMPNVTTVNWSDIPLNAAKQFDYMLTTTPASGGLSIEVRGYVVANGDV